MRRQRKRTRNVHQALPSDRQKQREHVSRKTERQRDNPRDKGEEIGGWGGCRERQRADETVSSTVPRKQVEDKGRMVASQRWRRWMDKRACESTLGCQTHCQTRGRFPESAFAVVNQAKSRITGLHKIRQGKKMTGEKMVFNLFYCGCQMAAPGGI